METTTKRRRTTRIKSALVSTSGSSSSGGGHGPTRLYNFDLALSARATLAFSVRNPPLDMTVADVLDRVKEKFNQALEKSRLEPVMLKRKKKIFWRGKDVYLVGEKRVAGRTKFKDLVTSKWYLLSLNDGLPSTAQSKRDSTPDSDLFPRTRDEYDGESALTELIDKSICAVCASQNQKFVSLDINEDSISILDTGDGINDCDVNSFAKWGRPIANLETLSKGSAPGGQPPYFRSTLGRLGYGGYKASVHLGRHTLLSSRTKESSIIYMLHFGSGTLHEQGASCSYFCWKLLSSSQSESDAIDSSLADVLDPNQRSFTRIEVFDHVYKVPDKLLPCRMKDIYFPFIQTDDSTRGRTLTIVTFQVNGINLAELEGGQVATMNLHSSNGPEFVVKLHFSMDGNLSGQRNPGMQGPAEANARLKCVYVPAIRGKEGIENILKNESFKKVHKYDKSSHVYVRWLGRLLTRAQWAGLPFMEPRSKTGNDYQVLKRCCRRVICFVDTDGGFLSAPLKTNLRGDHPFTKALRNLGDRVQEVQDVKIKILVSRKQLNLRTLETEYQKWVQQMHDRYDIENFGVDEPVLLLNPSNLEELGLSSKVVRVHKVLEREGKTWKSGQPIMILKGTIPGYLKTDIYAKLEYFLLEGLEGDAGGEARIICRPLEVQETDGCVLRSGNPTLDLRRSLSLPISLIDSEKCLVISDDEWNYRIKNHMLLLTMPAMETQSIDHCQDLMLDMGDSSPISCRKRDHSEIESGRQWKLLNSNGQPYVVRMGSCFPPFSVAGYDANGNCVPFDFAPEVMIKVESEKGLIFQVDKFIPKLSLDKKIMNVENLLIKASDIDKLCPGYEATLFMCECDNSLELQVPCKLMPGPLAHVVILSSEQSIELHPGYVFKDLKLELLDAYGNHVEEGLKVTLSLNGFQMLDSRGQNLQVDTQGYINLSGHLKVTGGYGSSVSLSVLLIDTIVFKKEFQIGKRELRIMSKVPEICQPGSKLYNLIFEINKSDGTVDENIHEQNKAGVSHLLRVDVQLPKNVSSELFPFQHGKCIVPAITLPTKQGCCSLVATHSDHPDLCLRFKVMITLAPKEEPTFPCPGDKCDKVPIGALKVANDIILPDLQGPSNQHAIELSAVMENLEKEINNYGTQIRNHELDIQIISSRKEAMLKDLSALRDYLSKKKQLEQFIESKISSAAAYYCHLSRTSATTDLLGLVALLGTAKCPFLARMLAEYLGEDQMLAVVVKSSTDDMLLDYETLVGAFQAKFCTGQQLCICLEDLRPYTGGIIIGDDQQRRLALPDPMLNSGIAPLGFRGYAVNLIDINLEHLDTRVGMLEFGLRETLFYYLFGELQVYETRKQMMAAWSCIKSGAISLDGGIVKGNGAVLLSFSEPEICFPVLSLDQPLDLTSGVADINRHIEAKIADVGNSSVALAITEQKVELCKKLLDEKSAEYCKLFGPLKSLYLNTQMARTLQLPSLSPQDQLPERKPAVNPDTLR